MYVYVLWHITQVRACTVVLDMLCTSSLKRIWLLLHSPWQQGVLWSYNYTQQQGVKDFLETIKKNIVSFPSAAIT